jgi:CRP-like cAMP-binding protein
MDRTYTRQLLSKHDLFGVLRPKETEEILAYASERSFPDGTTIFRKGDAGSSMMTVLRGRVRIGSTSSSGREVVFTILEPGSVFGELALMDGGARSADATAIGECVLLVLERRDFMPYLQRNPDVAVRLIGVLCRYVRQTSETIEALAFIDLPGRLARLLIKLSENCGRPVGNNLRIDLKMSQSDIGARIAASRESVNKVLRQWQDEGLIVLTGGQLTIVDRAGLEARAAENAS